MSRNASVGCTELHTLAAALQPLRRRSIGSSRDCAHHQSAAHAGATR